MRLAVSRCAEPRPLAAHAPAGRIRYSARHSRPLPASFTAQKPCQSRRTSARAWTRRRAAPRTRAAHQAATTTRLRHRALSPPRRRLPPSTRRRTAPMPPRRPPRARPPPLGAVTKSPGATTAPSLLKRTPCLRAAPPPGSGTTAWATPPTSRASCVARAAARAAHACAPWLALTRPFPSLHPPRAQAEVRREYAERMAHLISRGNAKKPDMQARCPPQARL